MQWQGLLIIIIVKHSQEEKRKELGHVNGVRRDVHPRIPVKWRLDVLCLSLLLSGPFYPLPWTQGLFHDGSAVYTRAGGTGAPAGAVQLLSGSGAWFPADLELSLIRWAATGVRMSFCWEAPCWHGTQFQAQWLHSTLKKIFYVYGFFFPACISVYHVHAVACSV